MTIQLEPILVFYKGSPIIRWTIKLGLAHKKWQAEIILGIVSIVCSSVAVLIWYNSITAAFTDRFMVEEGITSTYSVPLPNAN